MNKHTLSKHPPQEEVVYIHHNSSLAARKEIETNLKKKVELCAAGLALQGSGPSGYEKEIVPIDVEVLSPRVITDITGNIVGDIPSDIAMKGRNVHIQSITTNPVTSKYPDAHTHRAGSENGVTDTMKQLRTIYEQGWDLPKEPPKKRAWK